MLMTARTLGFCRRSAAILACLVVWVAALGLGAAAADRPAAPGNGLADQVVRPSSYPFTFVVFGDSRFTDPRDTRHSSAQVRQAEMERIAQERPEFVVITGDLVFKGDNARDWQVFDQETQPLRASGARLFPTLGNHDVGGDRAAALANYFRRFPELKERRWYSVRAGNLMLFALDSTADDGPGSPQWQWLENWLAALPPEVDFVLVVPHHPPYTRSTGHMLGGGHSARTRETELARMLEERQAHMRPRILVFAGHVHNYERYQHGGVTYIVSGGGGATPYLFERSPQDFYHDPGPTYHVCSLTVKPGLLQFRMLKLEFAGHTPQWAVRDSFELKTP